MSVDFTSVFTSERLIYEPFDNADEDTKKFLYHQMAINPAIKSMDSIQTFAPVSKSSYYDTLAQWKQNLLSAIICLKPDNWDEISQDYTREEHTKSLRGVPIGMVCVSPLPASIAHHRRVGLGISIATKHQGQGYATEALRWVVDWVFDYANMHSLFLQTISANEKAIHVYKKVGFTENGRDPESLFLAGKWYDTVNMSILEQDWRAQREERKKAA